jgi:CII-binding regulator of phage lambda lysogenization HflD
VSCFVDFLFFLIDISEVMTDEYIQKFIDLPPFTNNVEDALVEKSISETFELFGLEHSTIFCRHTILSMFDDSIEWDRMLYICDGSIPVLAFISSDIDGDPIFVDSYGNFFPNEVLLLKSMFFSTYYRYYNTKKIFDLTPYESSEKYLKDMVRHVKYYGLKRCPKAMEMFIAAYQNENAFTVFKHIKVVHPFFLHLSRIFKWITELKMGEHLEILRIKVVEPKNKKEIIIEVNMEKMLDATGYAIFYKEMWRIEDDSAEKTIKEESLKELLSTATSLTSTTTSQAGGDSEAIDQGAEKVVTLSSTTLVDSSNMATKTSTIVDRYVITMNRNFEGAEELMVKCNTFAERISQEIFGKRVKIPCFKNIVLWLRERLSKDYSTDEEIINEYRYLLDQISYFRFRSFKYSNTFSAIFHIYKHFDDIINHKMFQNYKRVYLSQFMNKTKIFGEIVKGKNNDKLLSECFSLFFNIAPIKLFKKKNLVLSHFSGNYHAYTFALDELIGTQFKFRKNGPLSIATMYINIPEDNA